MSCYWCPTGQGHQGQRQLSSKVLAWEVRSMGQQFSAFFIPFNQVPQVVTTPSHKFIFLAAP